MANLVELEAPPPVPWWPPAPGWFVVAGLVLLACCWVVWKAFKQWKANAYRREGIRLVREVVRRADTHSLDTIATALKRVAIGTFGRKRVAAMSGSTWLAFLDRTGGTTEFSTDVGSWLTKQRYEVRTESINPKDLQRLANLSTRWIRSHRSVAEADQ